MKKENDRIGVRVDADLRTKLVTYVEERQKQVKGRKVTLSEMIREIIVEWLEFQETQKKEQEQVKKTAG